MVDVSSKPSTVRSATATGYVRMNKKTLDLLESQTLPKGDALTVAEVAGIMAAKRTSDLIPLCHPLALTNVTVHCEVTASGVLIRSEAATLGPTGVEMEALAAASIAALTLYDMCKSVDPGIVIADVRLNSKSGGASGDWTAAPSAEIPAVPVDEAEYGLDDIDLEEEEEQIVPRSIPQPEPPRGQTPYRRDNWSGGSRPPARPYDQDRGSYPANRPATGYQGQSGGFNRDRNAGSGYGNRQGPSRPPSSGYQGNRDRNAGPGAGGFNRDRGTGSGGYPPANKPGYGYQGGSGGFNRDRGAGGSSGYGNRNDNRTDNKRPGYTGNRNPNSYPPGNNPNYRPGGFQGNRDRGSEGYTPKPGFAGFRDRNRDRDRETE